MYVRRIYTCKPRKSAGGGFVEGKSVRSNRGSKIVVGSHDLYFLYNSNTIDAHYYKFYNSRLLCKNHSLHNPHFFPLKEASVCCMSVLHFLFHARRKILIDSLSQTWRTTCKKKSLKIQYHRQRSSLVHETCLSLINFFLSRVTSHTFIFAYKFFQMSKFPTRLCIFPWKKKTYDHRVPEFRGDIRYNAFAKIQKKSREGKLDFAERKNR